MEEIPGTQAETNATLSERLQPPIARPLPEWAKKKRWPDGPPPDGFFTPSRKRAQRYTRAFDLALQKGALSGHELVSSFRSGRGKPYRLDRPKSGVVVPVNAHWRLRGTYMHALEWVAYSQLVRKRTGLNATYDELGAVCDLGPDRMYQVMRTLRSWRLVGCMRGFWKPKGALASSQRANTWYLTKVAAYAFGLKDPETYRDPDDDAPAPPPAKPIKRSAPDPEKTTRHSESPRVLSNSRENFARVMPAPLMGAVSPAMPATLDFISAVPAEVSAPSQPAVSRENCEVSLQPAPWAGDADVVLDASVAAEREVDAANSIGDALKRVRRGDIDHRPPPDPDEPRDTRRITRRREAVVRDEELIAERELERMGGDPQDLAGGRDNAGAAIAPDTDDAGGELERARREDLERYRRSLEDNAGDRQNRPMRPPVDDFDDVLRRANESFERRRSRTVGTWMRNRRKPGGAS
jgi:hypothetical protein